MAAVDIDALDQQLQDLQARYAFQEDLVHSLNQLVAEQQNAIARLTKQYRELKGALDETLAEMASLRPDEPPPHY